MGFGDWFGRKRRAAEPTGNLLVYLPAGTPDAREHGIQPVGSEEDRKAPLAWVEGPDGERWLDCRSVTRGSVSTAKDRATLERFVALRRDGGEALRATHPAQARTFAFSMPLPSPPPPPGRLFSAPRLEYKWDSAYWDGAFLLTRSWTGDLVYRFSPSTVTAEVAQAASQGDAFDRAALHFLMREYVLGERVPHPLPALEPGPHEDVSRTLALWSLSFFGCDACFGKQVPVE